MNVDIEQLVSEIPSYREAFRQGKTLIPDPFIYTCDFTAAELGAGLSPTKQVNIQSDADFVILAQAYYAADDLITDYAAATAKYPNVSILLTDSGSGRQLMDNPVNVTSIFGNGQFPYILPQPRFFAAKSTLTVKPTNRDTNSGTYLYLSFIGLKLYLTSKG